MVAVRDFSGLDISAWALASAAARMPTLGLDCCMIGLFSQQFEADGSGFRAFCFHTVPGGFPGVLGHQGFELCLGLVMVEGGSTRQPVGAGKLRPRIRRTHIDGSDCLNARPRWLDAEKVGGLAGFGSVF